MHAPVCKGVDGCIVRGVIGAAWAPEAGAPDMCSSSITAPPPPARVLSPPAALPTPPALALASP